MLACMLRVNTKRFIGANMIDKDVLNWILQIDKKHNIRKYECLRSNGKEILRVFAYDKEDNKIVFDYENVSSGIYQNVDSYLGRPKNKRQKMLIGLLDKMF